MIIFNPRNSKGHDHDSLDITKISAYLNRKRIGLLFSLFTVFIVTILVSSSTLTTLGTAREETVISEFSFSPAINLAYVTATIPSAPTLVSATPGSGKITLTWSAPASNGGSPITGYQVYIGTTPGAEVVAHWPGNVLTFTDTDLTNGVKYYYKVSATNSAGEGPLSNERSATPTSIGVSIKFTITSSAGTYTAKRADGTTLTSGTSATTVIQAALNALTSGRTVKEKVLLQGNFIFSTTLTVPSYTILELSGKVTMSSTSNNHAVSANSKTQIDIQGGEWDGNQMNNPYGGGNRDAFHFTSCSYVVLQNLKVHDCPYGNIEFDNSNYITIYKVESYNSGDPNRGEAWRGLSIILANTSNSLVDSCYIHDSARGGVYFYCECETMIGLPDKPETINNNIMRNNQIGRASCRERVYRLV
jgi:hypothetical protein